MGDVREEENRRLFWKLRCEQLERQLTTLQAEKERLEGELGRLIRDMRAIDGCFEAALCEGWNEVVADGDVDRITDIYHRRIEYARHTAVNAISQHEHPTQEPTNDPV